jgi:NAD-dependent deacetylase
VDELETLASLLAVSNCVVVLTGAGISTPSGIPDFRGPQGLWRRVDPEKFTIEHFFADPDEVWSLFVNHFVVGNAEPNSAHMALATLEEWGKICGIITQNVDGLHQRAGSKRVVELHGSLKYAVCTSCGSKYPLADVLKEYRGVAPRCKICGGLLKPDVVFFGEPLPRDAWEEAVSLAQVSDLFLAVGTSLAVAPANRLPYIAKSSGAKLAIINEEPTELDHIADVVIRGKVEAVLPRLVQLTTYYLKGPSRGDRPL